MIIKSLQVIIHGTWSQVKLKGWLYLVNFDESVQIPTLEEQKNAVYPKYRRFEKNGDFPFSQEEIDRCLVIGSGFEHGKYRIYQQFLKHGTISENATFLKNEYGTGGSSPKYGRIDEDHSSKGMTLSKYREIGHDEIEVTLKWDKVAKRISELVSLNRYLSPKELEHYPIFLEEQIQSQLEYERRQKQKELGIENTPIDVEYEVKEEVKKDYQWELGDTVYVGLRNTKLLKVVM